jgi:hypothetical protein
MMTHRCTAKEGSAGQHLGGVDEMRRLAGRPRAFGDAIAVFAHRRARRRCRVAGFDDQAIAEAQGDKCQRGRSLPNAAAMREVERMANDPTPMAERPVRVAALERELDELYRIEEALVSDATAAGQAVHRRSDVTPAAVLGVKLVEAKSCAA